MTRISHNYFLPVVLLALLLLGACNNEKTAATPANETETPPASSQPDPQPEPQPNPDPQPEPQPDPAPQPEPQPDPAPQPDPQPVPPGSKTWYKPPVGATWQWQLSGDLNTSYSVDVYDIDLFDTPREKIAEIQATGKKVICYFSAGSWENWRPDKDDFPASVIGKKMDGWPGEKWLDIRSAKVRQIMMKRLDLAQQKNCDAIEPDNIASYNDNTGFPLTANDQLDYNRFLAQEAHKRGLGAALKNDLNQVQELVDVFDFSINEQCFQYDECDLLKPFINAGKAVFNAEYKSKYVNDPQARQQLCTDSLNRGFSTLILPKDLDDEFRFSCN